MHSPVFDDIYTSEILVEFDYSGVDFSKVQKKEEQKSVDKEEKQKSNVTAKDLSMK